MSDDKRVDRRRFFRAALGELFKPLEKKAAPLQRALEQFTAAQQNARPKKATPSQPAPLVRPPPGRTAARGADPFGFNPYEGSGDPYAAGADDTATASEAQAWLRPPGAAREDVFRGRCTQCNECVRVCPARCIKIEPGGRGGGYPFIAVDEMPCVLCDGLLCMDKCPTNALAPTPLTEIDMGTAAWHADSCVRARHEECSACVDQCPLGSAAIGLRDGKIHVIEEGCVGCGVCEHFCPTTPKSITVTPKAARVE